MKAGVLDPRAANVPFVVLIYTFTVGSSAGFKLFELRFDTFVLTQFCGVDVVDGESNVVVFASWWRIPCEQ